MGRKTGLFTPILLIVGIFFFLVLGILMLDHAPTVDENLTPTLAETANETAMFHEPVQIAWRGAIYVVVAFALVAVLGHFAMRMSGGRRGPF